jgi:putative transcriptional regulator
MRKINYKKLWVKIAENEMSRAEFRKKVDISPNTLTKLNQNENVSLDIIIKICEFLNCDIGDVCEIIENGEG